MLWRLAFSQALLVSTISLALARGQAADGSRNVLEATVATAATAATATGGGEEDAGPKATVYMEGSKLAAYNTCSEKTASDHFHRDLMLVSTLDGKVSALDIHNAGSVQWTLDTDIGPLMDASIGHFEIMGPDGRYKVIPSLDGGLFRWDGQSVEPVPLNADMLLSSSFKLSDDAVIVGGKETSTYGINAGTGQIVYICGVNGCHKFDENESTAEDDIIVIERIQRTCRAVDQRTGAEKWNFSVGQHDVSFLPGAHKDKEGCHQEEDYEEDYPQETVCVEESEEEELDASGELAPPGLKVFISPGTVLAYSPKDAAQLLWKQEFSTAISAAWVIKDGKLKQVDLFDVKNIPLLGLDGRHHPSAGLNPALYMGEYNSQAYVHPSQAVQDSVREMSAAAAMSKDMGASISIPRVQWRPYMSTAPSRTPIVAEEQSQQRTWAPDSKAVTVWSQYPFDVGYYVLQSPAQYQVFGTKKDPDPIDSNESGSSKENEGLEILLSVSATFWWKEILAISLALAVGMQVVCHMLRPGATLERVNSQSVTGSVSTQESVMEDAIRGTEDQPREYKSRYLTDFQHQLCLGKGGFGIVFEAKNVVDENSYAVKRICLPNRTKAREKVLREARALARLDHSGIVRYFNSWLEEPPAGWQKLQDEHLLGDSTSPSHTSLLSHSTTANFTKDSQLVRDKEQFLSQTSPHLRLPARSRMDEAATSLPPKNEAGDLSTGTGYLSNISEVSDSFHIEFRDDSGGLDNSNSSGSWGEDLNLTPKADEKARFHLGANGDSDHATPMNTLLNVPLARQSSLLPRCRAALHQDAAAFTAVFDSDSSEDDANFEDDNDSDLRAPTEACMDQSENSFQVVFESESVGEIPADPTGLQEESVLASGLSGCPDAASKSSTMDCCQDAARPKLGSGFGGESTGQGDCPTCPPSPRVYLYIQMQLCQKETLKDWLGANTLSRDRTRLLHIFQQILAAVQYVHSCGMIHRDLKPSNIFFSVDGTVKVGDFGLVTAVDTQLETAEVPDDDTTAVDLSRTHTGQVGTQLYMSPEQLCGKSYDHKVDIFSLGLIFFELLHPFSTQMERIMVMTSTRQQKFPERFAKELPTETELIKMLLSSNPMERPDTDEFMEKDIFMQLYKGFVPPNPPTNRGRYASNSSN